MRFKKCPISPPLLPLPSDLQSEFEVQEPGAPYGFEMDLNHFWNPLTYGWGQNCKKGFMPSVGYFMECQNFPGNKIPGQKISRRNVPGQENSGTRKFQEFHFFPEFEKYFFEKIPGFFPAGAENSRTFNPT